MPKIVDHAERRRVIVEALWRVVARGGAAAVSVRSVAAEAGMPKSSIGHYVGTQPQLLSLAVAEMVDYVTAQVSAIDADYMDASSAAEVILTLIPTDSHRRSMSEVWLLLLSQRNAEPELGPILTELNATVLAGIASTLETMQEQGGVAASRDLAIESRRLHALVDGLAIQSLTDPDFLPKDAVRRILTAHLSDLTSPIPVTV